MRRRQEIIGEHQREGGELQHEARGEQQADAVQAGLPGGFLGGVVFTGMKAGMGSGRDGKGERVIWRARALCGPELKCSKRPAETRALQ